MLKSIPTFFSYSHHDRELAGKIKSELERYGLDILLAYEDIEPSLRWQNRVLVHLKNCKVFIALLTEAFDKSNWTHQEVGAALIRGFIMVPIVVEKNPVGFLEQYQAIRVDADRVTQTCFRIVKSIARQNKNLAKKICGHLIDDLAKADTFDKAGSIVSMLRDLNGFTGREMGILLKSASHNTQVYQSHSASGPLRDLIKRHKRQIEDSVLKAFYRVWGYRS